MYRCTRENGRWAHKKDRVPLVSSARVVTVTGQSEGGTETGQQCHPVCSRHHSIPAGREKQWVSQWCVLRTCNATKVNTEWEKKERRWTHTPTQHNAYPLSLLIKALMLIFHTLSHKKKLPSYLLDCDYPKSTVPKPPSFHPTRWNLFTNHVSLICTKLTQTAPIQIHTFLFKQSQMDINLSLLSALFGPSGIPRDKLTRDIFGVYKTIQK